MDIVLLRRRKLGNGSCLAIKNNLHEMGTDIWTGRMDQNPPNADVLIRWGCTDNLHSSITINNADMIHRVNDKAGCRKLLQDHGICVPRSFFDKRKLSYMGNIPVLIGRKQFHHQGRKIKVIHSLQEFMDDYQSAYWSEFIDKEKEYRVFVFFGKVLMVAEKVLKPNQSGVAWNVAQGNVEFVNVPWTKWPLKVCEEALNAQKVTGIDFAGVDVMTKDEKPYILELNSAHSLTSPYRQKTFAKALKWLLDTIKETERKPQHFDLPERITYKTIILPYLDTNRE